ncbi:FKBP-type peptidyl-prolyl cis-trans isomerase [Moraxella sp. FZLJ2107]|uniref:FKBP-type peptidyl-prolyl cis-trans isomerase n=1 Tax=unclassified Moraxella TaxID=2685852 RepID=UPI00209BC4E5|nr:MULTISPECIES: FKBP-type peptidyl-prolyl cis-trans isomerase [unclassified Moraxella]USZ13992.1 FKBP-type peptidyl-prolyl cis-trans isomerase [Moraxella sp. FZFQ2102]UTO04254.1 FKBP-type peptidyl-prolyl cis-trans isomerase [Moraxella sp. FZLJ2107]UTO23087.1 FKBP-type peptidyl-prolyl cis-trans isomerase [Moraxella sp. FZLJ2109]
MKKQLLVSAVAAALVLTGCNKNSEAAAGSAEKSTVITDKSTEMQKVSYVFGHDAGQALKQVEDKLDLDVYYKAFKEGYEGKESALTPEQVAELGQAYEKRKAEEMKQKIAKNKTDGEKFLADNAKKEGVKTTASGLQYKVITEGSGTSPKATDTVVVNYEGKLIDGTVFDSSYERGMPAQFQLNQVIKGWTEGLQLMKPGAKYELYVPAELAYGEQGNQNIEPNSVLIFTVELLNEAQIKEAQAKMEKMMQEQARAMEEAQKAAAAQSADAKPADAQSAEKPAESK